MINSFFLITIFFIGRITSENACGDWEPYRDEKCLKIFESLGLSSYQDAENLCKTNDQSNLISIGLEEKQRFLETFLQSNNVVDNAWIGLRYVDDGYQWSDGTDSHYLNWANGSPKNDSDYCVQIETDDTYYGQWSEVLCSKKNLVVCEKIQSWSQSYIQNQILELSFAVNQSKQTENDIYDNIRELKNSTEETMSELEGALTAKITDLENRMAARISQLENTVTDLYQNPVPIGFIYVQLPKEKSPKEIWSWMEWADVSSDYAGLFFRTVGGNAAAFGQEQGESSPRLIEAKNIKAPGWTDSIKVLADGQFSTSLHTGIADNDWGMRFKVSQAEVRPRNMAVIVWKRIK